MRLMIRVSTENGSLLKSLNPRLIRREITVHGPTGAYQRMAWVLPEDVNTNNPHMAQFDLFDDKAYPADKKTNEEANKGNVSKFIDDGKKYTAKYLFTFPNGEVHKRKVLVSSDGWIKDGDDLTPFEDYGDAFLTDEDLSNNEASKQWASGADEEDKKRNNKIMEEKSEPQREELHPIGTMSIPLDIKAKENTTTKDAKPLINRIRVTKVSKRQIEFDYYDQTYVLGARPDNVIAYKTHLADGRAWYNLGGSLKTNEKYSDINRLADALREKYGKFDREKQMYEFKPVGQPEKHHEVGKHDFSKEDIYSMPSDNIISADLKLKVEAHNKKTHYDGKTAESYMVDNPEAYIETKETDGMIDYNRSHFNQLNAAEQEKYMYKLRQRRKEYRLCSSDGSFWTIPSYVYEYLSLKFPRRNGRGEMKKSFLGIHIFSRKRK